MIMSGPVRIGKDAEVRETNQGTPVAEFPVAYDYGFRNDDGNRPTQWVVASLWGNRAKSLGPHLKSGRLIDITLKDMHVESFETANGTRYKLKGKVLDVEFVPVGNGRQGQSPESTRSATSNQGNGTRPQQSTAASNRESESAQAGVELDERSPFDPVGG